jgi:hypothetical protein
MPSTRCPLSAAVLKGVRTSIIEAHAAGNAPLQLVLTQRDAGTTQRVRRVNATVSRAEPGPTLVLSCGGPGEACQWDRRRDSVPE